MFLLHFVLTLLPENSTDSHELEPLDIFYNNLTALIQDGLLALDVNDHMITADPTSIVGDAWEDCPMGYLESTSEGFCCKDISMMMIMMMMTMIMMMILMLMMMMMIMVMTMLEFMMLMKMTDGNDDDDDDNDSDGYNDDYSDGCDDDDDDVNYDDYDNFIIYKIMIVPCC